MRPIMVDRVGIRFQVLTVILVVFGFLVLPMWGGAIAADLELDDQSGGLGSTVVFTLSVNNAPNNVSSLGLDIGFDPTVLQYVSADFTGCLLESFTFIDASNPESGVIRTGGFTVGEPLAAASTGCLARISFTVIGNTDHVLPLSSLKDDISGWTTKAGSFAYQEFGLEPASVSICQGGSVEFRVVPEGIGTPPFTWRVDGLVVQTGDAPTYTYRATEEGQHTISVEDSTTLSAQATATVEDEDDSGALDIPAASGQAGMPVIIPVRIQSAPNEVSSLGFDVQFDPSILQFDSADFTGTLLENFEFKQASNPLPGVVRVGGFTVGSPIPSGATGDLVNLTFIVSCQECTSSSLDLEALKDHIATWTTSGSCFLACCRCDGDVNSDSEISPLDALCAFETYLLICPTSCGIPCEDVCCDVSDDGDCSPFDAQCIFLKYLGLPSCLD